MAIGSLTISHGLFDPQHFPDFGDLIRHAITRSREANPVAWYKTVVKALHNQYSLLAREGGADHISVEWADLKVRTC